MKAWIVVFAASLMAQDLPPSSLVLAFEPAACGCVEVKIPEAWKLPLPLRFPGGVRARMLPSGHIVFGTKPGEGMDSLNHFGLLFTRRMDTALIFPVSPSEWRASRPIDFHAESVFRETGEKAQPETTTFQGREYAKSGRYWGLSFSAALPSPDERLLALQSFTGNRMGYPPESREGTIFIDVYATGTGKPVCRIRGTHSHSYGETLLEKTYWLDRTILFGSFSSPDRRRFLYCDLSGAQTAPPVTAPTAALDTRSVRIPAGRSTTLVDMTLDSNRGVGDNLLAVSVSHPALQVSLMQPNKVEVTAANAASLGYDWLNRTGAIGVPNVSPLPYHLIRLPSAAAAGTYQIQVTNTNPSAPGEVFALYQSNSPVHVSLHADVAGMVGETAPLTATCFRGTTPVNGATVRGNVRALVDITPHASVQNLTRVSTISENALTVQETYTGSLVNKGGAQQQVYATLRSRGIGGFSSEGSLSFGDIAANSTKTATGLITIRRGTSAPLDPASFEWLIEAEREVGAVSFTTSSPGTYTGSFVPSTAGIHTVHLQVVGKSEGVPFSRSTLTSFQVISPSASFVSFQDQAVDDNGNGLTDWIVTTANVNVGSAGTYWFELGLRASNGKAITTSASASLAAGSGRISVRFPAKEILSLLGVGGPYERRAARLWYEPSIGGSISADYRPSAGTTAAWDLSSFDGRSSNPTNRNAQ